MEIINEIIDRVNDIVWGPVMLVLLIGAGLFLTVITRGLQFRRFGYMMKKTILRCFLQKSASVR